MSKNIVLIVDDNEDICDVLNQWLAEEMNFEVFVANSGNEALEILQNHHIDHLISDVKMPNGSGYDLLVGINKLNIKLETIMIMTGYSDIKETEFKEQGADFFFSKPIDLFKISDILDQRRHEKAA
jgi:DNA-binding NtrC family response regulator